MGRGEDDRRGGGKEEGRVVGERGEGAVGKTDMTTMHAACRA